MAPTSAGPGASVAKPGRMFIFGLGYSAQALIPLLQAAGWTIAGTCRSEAKAASLRRQVIDTFVFDASHPIDNPAAALAGVTHLLVSVPPGDGGDLVLHQHGADILRSLPAGAWIGYLSTTGVYGDRGGASVDETADPAPSSARSAARVAAEAAWQALGNQGGYRVQAFRLAGIYGPGRSVLDDIRAGTARRIDKPGHVFSRIHVEDIAGIVFAALTHPTTDPVFNVADDVPAEPREVCEAACRLLGVEPPPLVPFEQAFAAMGPMARSFWSENRRVDNGLVKRSLGYRFRYPTFEAGLAAILAAELSGTTAEGEH